MAYTKTNWVNGQAPAINANNLNKMEQGIYDANEAVAPFSFAGLMMPYAGSTAPSGWLLCRGQAVSRTTYANLFSAIGTTYGAGDGSTTFNVPDAQGRMLVGVSATDHDFDLGDKGGSKTVTLTGSQIPNHSHGGVWSENGTHNWQLFSGGDITLCRTGDTNGAGGGQAHENMSPYLATNYIVKY